MRASSHSEGVARPYVFAAIASVFACATSNHTHRSDFAVLAGIVALVVQADITMHNRFNNEPCEPRWCRRFERTHAPQQFASGLTHDARPYLNIIHSTSRCSCV